MARWLVSNENSARLLNAWSSAAIAFASAASLDCTSTSNGRGSIRLERIAGLDLAALTEHCAR